MDADSILHLEEPIPNNCVITLDTLQYFFYCSGHIDIRDPDGNRLESIGYGIKRDNIESSIYRLKEQIYLLECLLCKLNNSLQLPAHAVSALGDVLYRMQGFCKKYIQ